MTEREDERLEQAVRGALLRRDPGPAPIGLRERVANVPEAETASTTRTQRLSRAAIPALGLAAAILLLVIATPLLAPRGVGPGASAEPGTSLRPVAEGTRPRRSPAHRGRGPGRARAAHRRSHRPRGRPGRASAGGRRPRRCSLILGFGGSQILLTHAVTGPDRELGWDRRAQRRADGAGWRPVPGVHHRRARRAVQLRVLGAERRAAADPSRGCGRGSGRAGPSGTTEYPPTLRAVWRDPPNTAAQASSAAAVDTGRPRARQISSSCGSSEPASPCAFGPTYDPALPEIPSYVGIAGVRVEYKRPRTAPNDAAIDLPYDLLQPIPDAPCPPQP